MTKSIKRGITGIFPTAALAFGLAGPAASAVDHRSGTHSCQGHAAWGWLTASNPQYWLMAAPGGSMYEDFYGGTASMIARNAPGQNPVQGGGYWHAASADGKFTSVTPWCGPW